MRSIPWELIAPHERQATKNHYQSLERLAERGGLSPSEAIAVIRGTRWSAELMATAEADLAALAAPPTAGAEREGWQWVPTTPTQEMCQAGQWKANEWPIFPLRISPIYKAMLAAAPSAPSDQQGGRNG